MKIKKFLILFLSVLGAGVLLASCGNDVDPHYKTRADLAGKRIGYVATSTQYYDIVKKGIVNPDLRQAENLSDCASMLLSNKVDGYICDSPLAKYAVVKNPQLKILDDPLAHDNYGFMVNKGYSLLPEINQAIIEFKANGILKELEDKWYQPGNTNINVTPQTKPSYKYTIRTGTLGLLEPMNFFKDGEITGFELDLLHRIGDAIDAKIVVSVTPKDISSLCNELEVGNIDLAFTSLSISEERKQKFDFSETYYDGAVVIVIKNYDYVDSRSFWDKIKDSFVKTFVTEQRWLMILSGLGYTVLISISSGILGLLIGSAICAIRRSRSKAARGISGALIHIIQGTPAVVLLMILYYGIFGKIDINATLVAILGFSIMFGVYSSEIMRSGFDSLDKGQHEAALAMGYSRTKAFMKVSLPQASHKFIPVLTGEFISMVKMTSVAGYISVAELTRIGDIIRAQTLEAFFPLIAIALLYFGLCELLTFGLRVLHKKLDPKHHAKKVKGVYVINDGKDD